MNLIPGKLYRISIPYNGWLKLPTLSAMGMYIKNYTTKEDGYEINYSEFLIKNKIKKLRTDGYQFEQI